MQKPTYEWRAVEGFPGWVIDDLGNVMNEWSSRIMTTRLNQQGIVMVNLERDRKRYTRSLALLVAKAFLVPENDYFDSVIHLNGDRADCRAFNILWRSRPFALRYHDMFNQEPSRYTIYVEELDKVFHSVREFCTTYGLIERSVLNAMQNREPTFPCGFTVVEYKADEYHDVY